MEEDGTYSIISSDTNGQQRITLTSKKVNEYLNDPTCELGFITKIFQLRPHQYYLTAITYFRFNRRRIDQLVVLD